MCSACVCVSVCGEDWDVQERGRWRKNDGNRNDKDGSADIIDMNSSCISLANRIRFSFSAVIIFFNPAHDDTLWHVVKLQRYRSP